MEFSEVLARVAAVLLYIGLGLEAIGVIGMTFYPIRRRLPCKSPLNFVRLGVTIWLLLIVIPTLILLLSVVINAAISLWK